MNKRDNNTCDSKRIYWIDIAKALSLLLVIAGHTIGGQFLVQTLSFGVCSFFIFSGMTSRFSTDKNTIVPDTIKCAKKLLLPPAITYLLVQIYIFISNLISMPLMEMDVPLLHPHRMIFTLIFSRCNNVQIGSYQVKEIGILWFFSALFSCWVIFNILQVFLSKKLLPLGITILSVSGFFLSYFGIVLPLNIDIAVTILPLIYFGFLLKPLMHKYPSATLSLTVKLAGFGLSALLYAPLCYLVNMRWGMSFDLASASYHLYPLCILMPLAGTLALSFGCMILEKFTKYLFPLIVIGRNTLYLFCFHSVDRTFIKIWEVSSNNYVNFLVRLVLDLSVMCILIYISSKNDSRK